MKRPISVAMVAVLSVLLSGCPADTSIWIVPGSTLDSLTFALGKERGHEEAVNVSLLRIDRCDAGAESPGAYPPADQAVWLLEAQAGSEMKLSKVVYGEVPTGYTAVAPASPLQRPGCYVATISGTGVLGFRIDSRGAIAELSQQEVKEIGF